MMLALAGLLATALTACGGNSKDLITTGGSSNGGSSGSSGSGGGTDSQSQVAVAMSITDASGVVVGTADRPITENRSGKVKVQVTNADGGIANQVVTFSSTLGEFDPAATALTDVNGVAEVSLKAGSQAGADILTASADVGGKTYTQTLGFRTTGSDQTGDSAGGGAVSILIGSGTGAAFQEGEVGLSATTTSAKSTLSAIVNLVTSDTNGAWDGSAKVSFSSSCATAGKASFDPQEVIPVAGTAVTSYQPENGCTEDVITASVTISGEIKTATSPTITVEQSPPASLTFLGAEPPIIGIKGSAQVGAPESSVLSFQVKDSNGDPATAGESVSFSVASDNGGFAITSDTTASTNAQGVAQVTVRSGTVPFSAFVLAELASNGDISSTGSVSVQSGPITQSRFSLALDMVNPKAGNHQGLQVPVNVRAADRFGNWAPDGTRINFTSELGDIDGSCQTVDGTCSVVWTSQAVQTIHFDKQRDTRSCFSGTGPEREQSGLTADTGCGDFDRFGRNTITAWTVGEESFSDENGNNLFDVGEDWLPLAEAFRDDNGTGIRDNQSPYSEEFMDYNSNGTYDSAGTVFRGLGCSDAASVAGNCESLANVRDSSVMALSTDTLQVEFVKSASDLVGASWESASQPGMPPQNWGDAALKLQSGTTLSSLDISPGSNSFVAVIADVNGNAPFNGLHIFVTGSTPDVTVLGGQVRCDVDMTTEAVLCPFTVQAPLDPTEFSNANLTAVTVSFAYPGTTDVYPGGRIISLVKVP
ncbi:hypothetical protein [Alcanivorax hongdengensis]|uniref:hypothetical protein n=1 Tax=Alcanivorax hongdengensis TaxID=519051 RepID=UPI0012FB7A32|nr:hypothetical protein [Alcanivorax hongdengensis]